mgnify:CR=1 FL=1
MVKLIRDLNPKYARVYAATGAIVKAQPPNVVSFAIGRLEKMARAFKDEIDTLNEALVIAARDIASTVSKSMTACSMGHG